MFRQSFRSCFVPLVLFAACIAVPSAAGAQTSGQAAAQPAATTETTPPWTGSAGLGFTMNRGNTDTTDFNLTFDAKSDAKKKDVWKLKGHYQHNETDGALSADKLVLEVRYERALTERVYAYAGVGFLHDEFKSIDYLWAPGGGLGYKVVATEQTMLNVDAGLGAKIEKNPGSDATTDLGVMLADKFEHKLSKTSAITQGFAALWSADDFGDALYTFSAGLAAAVTSKTQIKIELFDAYATRPPSAEIKKNDVSLITSFVYKF
jgi:putative salt-induced outer membrane protein